MTWNPTQYLQYAGERMRPALDLLARVSIGTPETVVDLGCGAGNVTGALADRWPQAAILGVDNDPSMLARARASLAAESRVRFVEGDIATWLPERAVDVFYTNAALHWVEDHATLFPRLLDAVAPGGALAVQMPSNFGAPSHRALFATAIAPRWCGRLQAIVRPQPVASAEQYFEWLAARAAVLDVWTTEYLQLLAARADGEHPVVAWMRGTALLPFVTALDETDRADFVADFAARIAQAYRPRADGSVLFPFRRLFIVARRAG